MSILRGRFPILYKHFCPFLHPNFATSPFQINFLPLELHVFLKTFQYFLFESSLFFWMLMLASLAVGCFQLALELHGSVSSDCTGNQARSQDPSNVGRCGTPQKWTFWTKKVDFLNLTPSTLLQKPHFWLILWS